MSDQGPHGQARRYRRLRALVGRASIQVPRTHPHMLRHTYVTTMLDAGVPLRDVAVARRWASTVGIKVGEPVDSWPLR